MPAREEEAPAEGQEVALVEALVEEKTPGQEVAPVEEKTPAQEVESVAPAEAPSLRRSPRHSR